jgi:hypothetical protein
MKPISTLGSWTTMTLQARWSTPCSSTQRPHSLKVKIANTVHHSNDLPKPRWNFSNKTTTTNSDKDSSELSSTLFIPPLSKGVVERSFQV